MVKKSPPVSKSHTVDQLDLMFEQEKGLATKSSHFIYALSYDCATKHHEDCNGSKCYCPCHYRVTKYGGMVKLKKDEVKAEKIRLEEERFELAMCRCGLLPGEQEMSDVPLTQSGKPKGFKCSVCNQYYEFDVYVLAHWRTRLVHECDMGGISNRGCGAKHAIEGGVALNIKTARKDWLPF